MNPKKAPGKKRKNAGLSLHPDVIALLDKHRGRRSKSSYAEEIIADYFRKHAHKLSPDDASKLGRASV